MRGIRAACFFVAGGALAGACGPGASSPGAPACPAGQQCWPEQEATSYFSVIPPSAWDILFVIDDSPSMVEEQGALARNLTLFTNILKSLPGGLPDVHIGIVSSSMGAGSSLDVPGCAAGGAGGRLQSAPRSQGGACARVPRGSFISAIRECGEEGANFDGDIADVLSCIGELGAGGCGVEQPLAAARRALGGDPGGAPSESAGFLRDHARLAIIFITDEDDCSLPPDSTLFAGLPMSPADSAAASFRCAEAGHLCGGQPPPRTATAGVADCRSAEGAGSLGPVAEYASFFKSLKAYEYQLIVSVIGGPTAPYGVVQGADGQPALAPSCVSATAEGRPAVRLAELVAAFPRAGSFMSICNESWGAAMDKVGKEITGGFERDCLAGPLVDRDPEREGVQVDCSVTDVRTHATGDTVSTPLPACEEGAPPCWRAAANPTGCPAGMELQIDRGGCRGPRSTTVVARCAVCATPDDPRCPR